MKKYFLPTVLAMAIVFSFSCKKEDDNGVGGRATSMKDVKVSDHFTWRTTDQLAVYLPQSIDKDSSTIYIADNERLYYTGPAIQDFYKVTIPSFANPGAVKVYTENPFLSGKQAQNSPKGSNTNHYPASNPNNPPSFSTLIFEDLWPSKGDYDFNDIVVDYRLEFKIHHKQSWIEKITGYFVLRATGASFHSGFAFELLGIDPNDVDNVTGSYADNASNSAISFNANGTESGHNNNTNIVVFANAYDVLQFAGNGGGINVNPNNTYVEPDTIKVVIDFTNNSKIKLSNLSVAEIFNPYIIVDIPNEGRGKEIHLPGMPATSLASQNYFNTFEDSTDAAAWNGSFTPGDNINSYQSIDNYPWALDLYAGGGNFKYMILKEDIVKGYLKFQDWAEEGTHSDWYMVDNATYRDNTYIYQPPTQSP